VVEHETRRRDAHTINEMMTRITGERPMMWGMTMEGAGMTESNMDPQVKPVNDEGGGVRYVDANLLEPASCPTHPSI